MTISRFKSLYAEWQYKQTLAGHYQREADRLWRLRELAEFDLMLRLPYRHFKKLMNIQGGPWF